MRHAGKPIAVSTPAHAVLTEVRKVLMAEKQRTVTYSEVIEHLGDLWRDTRPAPAPAGEAGQ